MSSGVLKWYSSLIIALFKFIESKHIWSLGCPCLSVPSTSTKLLIYRVASCNGFRTLTLSILLISHLKASLRCIGMGLQGVCLGGTFGSHWILYSLSGNFPIPSNTSGNLIKICSFVVMILLSSGIVLVCVDLVSTLWGKVLMICLSFIWCIFGFCGLVVLGWSQMVELCPWFEQSKCHGCSAWQ